MPGKNKNLIPTKKQRKDKVVVRTNISSEGQLTIPKVFRKRVKLTVRQEVEVDQLPAGSVIVSPAASSLNLAGSITLNRSLFSLQGF